MSRGIKTIEYRLAQWFRFKGGEWFFDARFMGSYADTVSARNNEKNLPCGRLFSLLRTTTRVPSASFKDLASYCCLVKSTNARNGAGICRRPE